MPHEVHEMSYKGNRIILAAVADDAGEYFSLIFKGSPGVRELGRKLSELDNSDKVVLTCETTAEGEIV